MPPKKKKVTGSGNPEILNAEDYPENQPNSSGKNYFRKKYKNVPGVTYNKKGFTEKPEGYSVNEWGGYLQDAEKFHNKKKENWKPGKYLKLLKLKRKMKQGTK